MRRRRLRGLVLHHRRHPSAHPRRLVRRTSHWGDTPVRGVCRWCHAHAASIELTWHRYCLDAYLVASGQKPGIQVTMCEAAAVLLPSWTTGWRSTWPGRWGRRPCGGRSRSRISAGYAGSATGARPGLTAPSRGSCGPAPWTGVARSGSGDSTAGGPERSSDPSRRQSRERASGTRRSDRGVLYSRGKVSRLHAMAAFVLEAAGGQAPHVDVESDRVVIHITQRTNFVPV